MWKSLHEFAKQILNLTHRTEQNQQEIAELRQQLKEVASAVEEIKDTVQRLIYELRPASENERHEREKLMLRLENELLAWEVLR
ncbi:MAG: hypothetical protein ABIN58_03160 [candidate division WOR-3 bacterium]